MLSRILTWRSVAVKAGVLGPALCLLPAITLGASAFSVLNLDFLGRGGGTAGLTARVGDPDNACWNASALAFGDGSTVFAGYMDYLVGVRGGTFGYARGSGGDFGYGMYISYLSSGSLVRTGFDDPIGGRGDTFNYSEMMTGLAAGTEVLPFLSIGATVKLAREDLDEFSASGVLGDLSTTFKAYSPDPLVSSRPGIYTSYVLRNILLARWGDDGGGSPRNSEVGMALDFPRSGLVAGLSFYFGDQGRREIRLGLEVGLSEEFDLRFGYRRRTGRISDQAGDLPWERGLLAGFGLGFGPVRLNYAFEDASPLDNIHRFAVTSRLGRAERN
jgi:hypothetical protein